VEWGEGIGRKEGREREQGGGRAGDGESRG
jgi:hypothetical protein